MSVNRKSIVVGAGRLGSNIAKILSRQKDDVVLIDLNKDKLMNVEDFTGFLESGDATDMDFLEANGIKTADRAVFLTEDDNTNIFLADVCSHIYKVPEIYIKLKDSRKVKIVDPWIRCINPFDLFLDDFVGQMERKDL